MAHRALAILAFLLLAAGPAQGQPAAGPPAKPRCTGTYADSLDALSDTGRAQERAARYSMCIRSTAIYQCLSYDREGNVRRRRVPVVAHGTGFAFRRVAGATLLLTNQHVAEWPLVTGEDGPDEVPAGCKRVQETLAIVDDEEDDYRQDDVELQHVLSDRELDVAILKTPEKLPVMPFKLGQSAALAVGNVVHVRGFPLGTLETANDGKVVNTHDRDVERGWLHDDFVINATLSSGNSGSPVLAVSCESGAFELVGVYHASYRAGNAMNAVVGVDQFRELLVTLKPRKRPAETTDLGAADRARLLAWLRDPVAVPVIPFGPQPVWLRLKPDGVLVFEVFDDGFLLSDRRMFVVEDLPGPGFGRIGRVWFGKEGGLREWSFSQLEKADQALVEKATDALRHQALLVLEFRGVSAAARESRPAYDRLGAIQRAIDRAARTRDELSRALDDAATRMSSAPKPVP